MVGFTSVADIQIAESGNRVEVAKRYVVDHLVGLLQIAKTSENFRLKRFNKS